MKLTHWCNSNYPINTKITNTSVIMTMVFSQ